MDDLISKCAAAAVLAAALCAASLSPAFAEINDYKFELVQPEVKKANATILSLRLIDKRSGKLVPNAVIFSSRIDVAPEDMRTMTAPVEMLPSTETGVYRFKTVLAMAGHWQLSVAAKIQGETGTLVSKLTFQAMP